MPAARKTTTKATPAMRDRQKRNAAALERVHKSLESAEKAMSNLKGDLGSGAGDLRKNVARLIKDARRDAGKMNTSVRRDLERLQGALKSAPTKRQTGARASGSVKPRATKAKSTRSRRSA
jgi:hypothetical protein